MAMMCLFTDTAGNISLLTVLLVFLTTYLEFMLWNVSKDYLGSGITSPFSFLLYALLGLRKNQF